MAKKTESELDKQGEHLYDYMMGYVDEIWNPTYSQDKLDRMKSLVAQGEIEMAIYVAGDYGKYTRLEAEAFINEKFTPSD